MAAKDVTQMDSKELIDHAIELYESGVDVNEVLASTGLTRTRLYNNLKKRGKSPNRQVSNVKAEADREWSAKVDFYKDEFMAAREEIGALKYQIQQLQQLIEELEAASQPKKGITKEDWFNRISHIKMVSSPAPNQITWTADRRRTTNP